MTFTMWQTTHTDRAVAEEFFGWEWRAFDGRPVRGAANYNTEQRVRRFFPRESLDNDQWKEYFVKKNASAATGNEPLDYSYCSSFGPAEVPHYSGHWDAVRELEEELRHRKLWSSYREFLWRQISEPDTEIDEEALAAADCETRCIAALATVGSKFVRELDKETNDAI